MVAIALEAVELEVLLALGVEPMALSVRISQYNQQTPMQQSRGSVPFPLDISMIPLLPTLSVEIAHGGCPSSIEVRRMILPQF